MGMKLKINSFKLYLMLSETSQQWALDLTEFQNAIIIYIRRNIEINSTKKKKKKKKKKIYIWI